MLGGQGERLRLPALGPGGMEEEGPIFAVFLHEGGVGEARDHALLALDPGVGNGAVLLAVEVAPPEEGGEGGREGGKGREGGREGGRVSGGTPKA